MRCFLNPRIGVKVNDQWICQLMYADDTAFTSNSPEKLQSLLNELKDIGQRYDIDINVKKSKSMQVIFPVCDLTPMNLVSNGQKIEDVTHFKYLAVYSYQNGTDTGELKTRIAMVYHAFFMKRSRLFTSDLRVQLKMRTFGPFIWPVFSYGSEVWSLNAEMKSRINAFEIWCYRKFLRVTFASHTSIVENLRRINIPKRKLLPKIMRRILKFIGHVLRGSFGEELKTVLCQTVAQKNVRRGRKMGFILDDAWSLIQNDEFNEVTKLTLLIKRAFKQDIWRLSINEFITDPTLDWGRSNMMVIWLMFLLSFFCSCLSTLAEPKVTIPRKLRANLKVLQ